MIGAGFGGGPVNPPLAHLAADCVIAMNLLIENGGDVELAADALHEVKTTQWIDPEIASFSTNTVARKAEHVRRGPVTRTIINATDGIRANALLSRAEYAYDELSAGKSLEDICAALDQKRKDKVEANAGFSSAASSARRSPSRSPSSKAAHVASTRSPSRTGASMPTSTP